MTLDEAKALKPGERFVWTRLSGVLTVAANGDGLLEAASSDKSGFCLGYDPDSSYELPEFVKTPRGVP